MLHLSVRDAAKLAGKDRSTITRAIEKGKLSATRDEAGRFLIDPAELERAFGSLLPVSVLDDAAHEDAPHEAVDALHGLAQARELDLMHQMLEQERAERARERVMHERERESWESERSFLRGMLEKHTEQIKLLTDQRERTDRERQAQQRSWLARLLRRPTPSPSAP